MERLNGRKNDYICCQLMSMKKLILPLIYFCAMMLACGNMASPIVKGTVPASPYISRHVDIIHERIEVIPDTFFETAEFKVDYQIRVNKTGIRIPFLFYAAEYNGAFDVLLDGERVELSIMQELYRDLQGTRFEDFDYLFDGTRNESGMALRKPVIEGSSGTIQVSSLQYFEADLAEGLHTIHVRYIADKTTTKGKWVNSYSFRYALFPARHWKSFGTLEIIVDTSHFRQSLSTDLGPVTGIDPQGRKTWHFTSLPADMFSVTFTPSINASAQQLINVGAVRLSIAFAGLLFLLHLLAFWKFRITTKNKRFSRTLIAGSLVVPFLSLLFYISIHDVIDNLIGMHASHYHGYTFMALFLYPLLMPAYWILMWGMDKLVQRYVNHKTVS